MRPGQLLALLALLPLSIPPALGEPIGCTVVGVTDGDTLTCLTPSREQIKVRLAEIDAPERKQPFGERSKQSLSKLCFKAHAELRVIDRDRYGRTVARVQCNDVDANAEQIRLGMAWVYDRYARDPTLPPLQAKAKLAHAGLWSDSAPTAPWDWRKRKRTR